MNNNSPKFKALLIKGMVARKKSVSIVTEQKQIKTLLELFFFLYILHLTQEGFTILLVNELLCFPPCNVG